MRVVMFYHSLISDWNHGNAHFLRGVVTELLMRGHDVRVYEERDSWSARNLRELYSDAAIDGFYAAYPGLKSIQYEMDDLDLKDALRDADLVLVHEWNRPILVERIGRERLAGGDFLLFFHDTHHRAVSARDEMSQFDLTAYDGVLAFGEAISKAYRKNNWTDRAWTWHEAADIRVFGHMPCNGENRKQFEGDLVWIGNWGDDERTEELREFLLNPVKELGLKTRVYGVRYPDRAVDELAAANIEYAGWLPNYKVPEIFSRFRMTIHIPRRPYVKALPGIPTIRIFEALACGIPLVCSPWQDVENLFTPGSDYLIARDGEEMTRHLASLMESPQRASELARHGRQTILARHTCGHRVDELLGIFREVTDASRGVVA